jgi:hypothetical protein
MRAHGAATTADEYVREVLGIPRPLKVLAIVAVGVPVRRPKGIPASKLALRKIHWNAFGGRRRIR